MIHGARFSGFSGFSRFSGFSGFWTVTYFCD